MKYLAAYALVALSGKKDITANDLKTVLSSVQSHATDEDINKVISALKGKTIHQLISEGHGRLAGSGPAPAVAAPAKGADKKEAAKKQQPKKKEEPKKKQEPKKEEPKEEQFDDMGGLFD